VTAASGSADAWDLVAAAQAGDRDAYGQLYARYAGETSRLVWSRTGDQHLAQDLTSETFARGLRRIDSVSDQGKDPGAWFTQIAKNLMRDHWKSSRYKLETPTAEIRDDVSTDRGVERTVIDRDTAAEVRRRVAELSPAQRRAIEHRFFGDLSVAETAVAMGRNVTTVKALQHRGITALRAAMTADAGPRPPAPRDTADRLAVARDAVIEAHQSVTGDDHQAVEDDRARELSRFHTDDHTAGLAAGDTRALTEEGVA